MTSNRDCQDKTRIVSYLYGECDEGERRDVERHLRTCQACVTEVEGLQAVRGSLAEWVVPEADPLVLTDGVSDLGSREPPDDEHPGSPAVWWRRPMGPLGNVSGWLGAAAALLVISAAAGLAGLEVRYGSEGLVLRTGWHVEPSGAQAAAVPTPGLDTGPDRAVTQEDIAALEETLRQDLTAWSEARIAERVSEVGGPIQRSGLQTVVDGPIPSGFEATGDAGIDETMLQSLVDQRIDQQLGDRLDESERRQRRELAERLREVVYEFEAQRQADLLGMRESFGQLEGQAGIAVRENRELMDFLMRVSQPR